jgi:hypothetical protein
LYEILCANVDPFLTPIIPYPFALTAAVHIQHGSKSGLYAGIGPSLFTFSQNFSASGLALSLDEDLLKQPQDFVFPDVRSSTETVLRTPQSQTTTA